MAEQKSEIFRQESLERISSPDQLTDYLKVTSPSIWIVLLGTILLLGGIFIWSMTGNLETLSKGVAVVKDGTAEVIVDGENSGKVDSDMTVRIESGEYDISIVSTDEFGRTVAYAPVPMANGTYDAQIVIEKIHPISFLLQ